MPVLITAHPRDLDIVRSLASRLVQDGGEVRCYLEYEDHELRSIGCKIAVGSLEDSYTLASALTNVHTFVALAPDPLSFSDTEAISLAANLKAWGEAAREAKVAQNILVVSGLDVGSDDVCAAMREAELRFADVDPLCMVRCSLLVGEERPLQGALKTSDGMAVTVGELVKVIAAIDDSESTHEALVLAGSASRLAESAGADPRIVAYSGASLTMSDTARSYLGLD